MNGNETGRTAQNAREMTAEIDKITEAEVKKLEQQEQRRVNRVQAGSLGSQVLTYNPDTALSDATNLAPSYDSSRQKGDFIRQGNDGTDQGNNQTRSESNPVRQEAEVIQSNEQVLSIAKAEAGYTEAAEYDTSVVGAETAVQTKEWLQEDQEDIDNESGANGLYVKNLMERNNKRITNETVAAVDNMIAQKSYHPGELDEMANKARLKFLKDVFNRILGSRN